MSEMTQQPEHINDPAVGEIEQAALEQDIEKVTQILDDAESLSPD